MSEVKEIEVGQEAAIIIKAVEASDTHAKCKGCAFNADNHFCVKPYYLVGPCTQNYRTDGKNVIFEYVKAGIHVGNYVSTVNGPTVRSVGDTFGYDGQRLVVMPSHTCLGCFFNGHQDCRTSQRRRTTGPCSGKVSSDRVSVVFAKADSEIKTQVEN